MVFPDLLLGFWWHQYQYSSISYKHVSKHLLNVIVDPAIIFFSSNHISSSAFNPTILQKCVPNSSLVQGVTLCQMLAIVALYEMINVWDIVSAFIHLPIMFLFTDFLFEWWIGQVTMDFLYIRFTY